MREVRPYLIATGIAAALSLVVFSLSSAGSAAQPDCAACHEDLTTGKSVHAAVAMGCSTCHSAVDATEIPHKFTNRNPKGLMSKMRDLCYSCHDRKSFMKSTVHGAIALGCTTCHNPHVSQNARLLREDVPSLCIGCHKDRFGPGRGKESHELAGNEACSSCHNPHASDAPKLILSEQTVQGTTRTALNRK